MSIIITNEHGGIQDVSAHPGVTDDMLISAMSNKTLCEELKGLASRLPLPMGSRDFALMVEAAERIGMRS